jgi:hypothetical protein
VLASRGRSTTADLRRRLRESLVWCARRGRRQALVWRWGRGRREALIRPVLQVLARLPVRRLVLARVRLVDVLLDQVGRYERETLGTHLRHEAAVAMNCDVLRPGSPNIQVTDFY